MSDNSKLQSLKMLREQLKGWKKDDMRKKKGLPAMEQESQNEMSSKGEQDAQGDDKSAAEDDDSLLKKLLAKML